jgi:hypothetical protein
MKQVDDVPDIVAAKTVNFAYLMCASGRTERKEQLRRAN